MVVCAAPLLLWFAVAVRRVLRRAEGGDGYFADLFLVGTTANAALLVVAMAMQVAVVKFANRLTPETVRSIGQDFPATIVSFFGLIVAVTAFSFATVVVTTNVLPRWTAWLAGVVVALSVVGSVGVFFETGALSIEGGFTVFVPFISTMAWYLATSIAMLRQRPVAEVAFSEQRR